MVRRSGISGSLGKGRSAFVSVLPLPNREA